MPGNLLKIISAIDVEKKFLKMHYEMIGGYSLECPAQCTVLLESKGSKG